VFQRAERLAKTRKDRAIRAELQRQRDALGLKVRHGVVHDATFITADPKQGTRKRVCRVAATQRRGGARTARSWAKKGSKSSFGFKFLSKLDTDLGLIRALETTPASVHDSQIDLSDECEVVYRDKGFHGARVKGYSATMKRGARDHPLGFM
jgi:IS5 family transposase